MNHVTICGNLCMDPEIRTANSGTEIARLRIATNERRKQGDDWVDHAEFHSAVAFGKTAENIGRFFQKGRKILIEGSLRTSSWETDSGEKRYKTEIVVNRWHFCDSKGEGGGSDASNYGGGGGGSRGGGSRGGGGGGSRGGGGYDDSDDIPF